MEGCPKRKGRGLNEEGKRGDRTDQGGRGKRWFPFKERGGQAPKKKGEVSRAG